MLVGWYQTDETLSIGRDVEISASPRISQPPGQPNPRLLRPEGTVGGCVSCNHDPSGIFVTKEQLVRSRRPGGNLAAIDRDLPLFSGTWESAHVHLIATGLVRLVSQP